MKTLVIPKGYMACSTFPTKTATEIKNGLARLDHRIAAVWLDVLFTSQKSDFFGQVSAGDRALVNGNVHNVGWANRVLTYEGKEFILVPENQVQVIEKCQLENIP